jgi:hypothetical protein
VVLDLDLDQEVAVAGPLVAGRALAAHPERLAGLDPRGDLDDERRVVAHDAVAPAGRARLLVDGPLALTAPAGGPLLHPTEGGLLDAGLLPTAVALGAGPRVGPRRVAPAAAVRALLGAGDRDFLLGAVVGRLHVDRQLRLQVLPALRAVPRSAAAAEELVEDVLHVPEPAAGAAEGIAAAHAAGPAARVRRAAFLGLDELVVAHLVVHPAFLLVGQHLLGLLGLLEFLLGVGVVAHVRVVLPDRLAVGVLDLFLGSVPRNAEYIVEILCHQLSPSMPFGH